MCPFVMLQTMRPALLPIGLHLTSAARSVARAFDDALGEAGESLPVWLVLVNLKRNTRANQREIVEAMGISEATLTHHLNFMESEGFVARRRDPTNRRVHLIDLTDTGEAAFVRLRDAAITFDRHLRRRDQRERDHTAARPAHTPGRQRRCNGRSRFVLAGTGPGPDDTASEEEGEAVTTPRSPSGGTTGSTA